MTQKPRMRPRFEVALAVDGREVFRRLAERLPNEPHGLRGEVLDTHAYVRLPRERRSMLSPSMNLELRGEDLRRLEGRFVPHPSVWTGLMTLFATLGVIAFGALVYGAAQWTAHESPWALWLAPLSLALAAFIYGAAFIGQGLSNDEMYELRAFLDGVVRESEASVDDARAETP